LDTAVGLLRLGGNRGLYLNLLRQSLAFENAPAEIARALESGDWPEAERLAHTIKGVAATLGAAAVEKPALALEQALRSRVGAEAVASPLADLNAALSNFLQGLRTALPKEVTPAEESEIDSETAAALLAEMAALLRDFDVAACELFDSHRADFSAILGPAASEALQKQIANFAFAEALETLSPAAKETSRP
jgi:HPt (histidine-containing phosphotransfer) domain-containing protein